MEQPTHTSLLRSEAALLRRAAANFRDMAAHNPEIAGELCRLAETLEAELLLQARSAIREQSPIRTVF